MSTRQGKPAPSADVFARTAPLLVERHYFGESKSASLAPMKIEGATPEEEAATKALLGLTKRLLNAPETRAIRQCDVRFREFLKGVAVPFRSSLWLVPADMIVVVDAEAQKWEATREVLVDQAADAYPMHIEAMKKPLGRHFNPLDYPPVEVFKSKYWVMWRFIEFSASSVLRTVRADIWKRENEKVAAQAIEARSIIEQHLNSTLLAITQHLGALLAPKASGKRTALKEGAFDKLLAFLDKAPKMNVTDSEPFKATVARLRKAAASLDLEVLREDDAARDQIAAEMQEISAHLTTLVEDAPGRGIRVRDVEVA